MDILDNLHEAHDEIKAQVIDLQTMDFAPEKRMSAFRDLASLVDAHAKAEEAVVLAFARQQKDLRAIAFELLEEQDLTDELAKSIRRTEGASEHWEAKLNVYCHLIETQLEEKERELFPELFERLNDEQRMEMGERYTDYRELSLAPVRSSRAS